MAALLGVRECTVGSFQRSVDGPGWAFVDTVEKTVGYERPC